LFFVRRHPPKKLLSGRTEILTLREERHMREITEAERFPKGGN